MNRPGKAAKSRRTPIGSAVAALAALHDRITGLGVKLAMAGLAGIVFAYCYEVVARYFFNAPTQWSAGLVSYLLLVVTFLTMPQVTREGSHVAVTVVIEKLSPAHGRIAARVIAVAGLLVCAFLTYVVCAETLRQFDRGVRIMSALPVPKWWVSVWMIYGFAFSGLHFLRATQPDRESHKVLTSEA